MQYPSPYAKVFSLWCAGLASGTNNDFETALGCYSQALQLISDTRVAVEFETEIQAALAETHYSAGHFELALDLAQKTLVLSQQRSNRLTECRARIILGAVFRWQAQEKTLQAAADSFLQAEQLITLTNATAYQPSLQIERMRLGT